MPYVHTSAKAMLLLIQADNLCKALKEYAELCGLDLQAPNVDVILKEIYGELDSEIDRYINLQEQGLYNKI